MWLHVIDKTTNEQYRYYIPDAPPRLILAEETQSIDSVRFVYRLSSMPIENAITISFNDFIPILFFELGFEPVSSTLRKWIDDLVS